jgi:hypothetical protein
MSLEKEVSVDEYIPVAQEVHVTLDFFYNEKVKKDLIAKELADKYKEEYIKKINDELRKIHYLIVDEAHKEISRLLHENTYYDIEYKDFKKKIIDKYEILNRKKMEISEYQIDYRMVFECFEEAGKKFDTDKVYLSFYTDHYDEYNNKRQILRHKKISFLLQRKRSTCIVS